MLKRSKEEIPYGVINMVMKDFKRLTKLGCEGIKGNYIEKINNCEGKEGQYRFTKIEELFVPHPFVITAKHVVLASDRFGGILGETAIEEAEAQGIKCGAGGCLLPLKEHIKSNTAFLEVRSEKPLQENKELRKFLFGIKPELEKLNIDGVAFPKPI